MIAFLMTLFGYLLGALPFSLWIGRYLLGKDIRQFGDGNPGATNVLRAGGPAPFALALMLDITKGALPVGVAYYILGLQDWSIVPIGFAPMLGHAYSPFLNWQGGKAIAAGFGVWIGLTIWEIPLVGLTLLTIFSLLIRPSGWAVVLAMLGLLVSLLVWQQDMVLVGVWATHMALLMWTHRHELRGLPHLKHLSRSA